MPIILLGSLSQLLNTFLPLCHTFHRGEQAYDETMDLARLISSKRNNSVFCSQESEHHLFSNIKNRIYFCLKEHVLVVLL